MLARPLCIVCLAYAGTTNGDAFDRQWCVLTTPAFEYLTDESIDKARATVDDLSRFRELFMQLMPEAQGDSGLPLKMVMFSRSNDFHKATGSRHFGGFTLPSLFEYRLLMTRRPSSAVTSIAFHEYAHYLLRNQTDRSYPLWYEEGLATYLSAVKFDTNAMTLGTLPGRRLSQTTRTAVTPPLEKILTTVDVTNWSPRHINVFYNKAWLLVHFLRLGHQVGFDDLHAQLESYLADPARGFAEAFAITPKSMNQLLDRYRKQGHFGVETIAYGEVEAPTPTTRCLTDQERDLELAISLTTHNPKLSRELLTNLDGDATAARLVALSDTMPTDESDQALRLLREALVIDPDHAGALIGLANKLVRRCSFTNDEACFELWLQAAKHYRRALQIDPTRFDAAFGLGVAYTHVGRAGDAMNYLQVAYNKAPWAPSINFYLGEGYRIIGDKRAATYLSNARNWATEDVWRKRAELALERIP